ncbi:nucleotide sugar dehydrogenase [Rhizobium mayense]|uniref:Nucleotide sugar dehydrogenase n=1 Tax=Rhizobium mayense TaxID=1312184 RepID=A0ABT7JVB2_9HYPH|nr:nucleotide sugar dehydrogenase [Rhizobium mayense]MDL2399693.1 nucleotide sugar dehydrogenase [Rhizobium mayense]
MLSERIAVIGLGYVGLPVAIALAEKFSDVVGFDIKTSRVAALKAGEDDTREVSPARLKESGLRVSSDIHDLQDRDIFIVAVPTPIDRNRQPDLRPMISASRTVGQALKKGGIVVYESTVYPGVTEEVCGPVLAGVSGLRQGEDFHVGYSPERINPGDKEHTFERIVKVVAGDNEETLERIAAVYGAVVEAGIHRAPSIKVAEAAKVIENTQRDLNIALMNELSIIFEKMDIRTADVLKAARTKWNFLPFTPGLVGGHCIGVDPYYLTAKAEELGYHPEVILSGRRINDGMGAFIAQKLIKMLVTAQKPINGARIGIFGLTFKENVPDLRNSRVPDIIRELHQFGLEPLVHDPMASHHEAEEEYGVRLTALEDFGKLDAIVLAVPHKSYLTNGAAQILELLGESSVVVDVKAALEQGNPLLKGHAVWSL